VDEARTYGARIAIDDFGAGYSNLQHLLRLNVNSLKIDASLIRGIDQDANARAAVAAIVELARNTGIESTTAEYVHSAAVLEVVKQLGVDYSQGYLVGPPALYLVDEPAFLAA
jgi:EAL domain-containing protein (putative c-di-GMP-specific phosphodiesterase class I)